MKNLNTTLAPASTFITLADLVGQAVVANLSEDLRVQEEKEEKEREARKRANLRAQEANSRCNKRLRRLRERDAATTRHQAQPEAVSAVSANEGIFQNPFIYRAASAALEGQDSVQSPQVDGVYMLPTRRSLGGRTDSRLFTDGEISDLPERREVREGADGAWLAHDFVEVTGASYVALVTDTSLFGNPKAKTRGDFQHVMCWSISTP